VDGEITENPYKLQSKAQDFYNNLYMPEGTSRLEEVLNAVPRSVSAMMNEELTVRIQTRR
jgi:hypothetical protein